MAEHSGENEDRPFVDAGDTPPGRFVDGVWQGQLDWRTRHGPAIVHWYLGAPVRIENALLPDGARADLDGNIPAAPTFRIKSGAGDSFVHGTAAIARDDVVFTPLDDALEDDIDDDLVRLLSALRRDDAFIRDMEKPVTAAALYAEIENKTLTGAAPGEIFELGQRSAASLVAALRANGETYLDYAWGRSPVRASPADCERVRAHLARMGWKLSAQT
jgi:hypothetical protein